MPKVSIILPAYNAENTIDRCMESIENQTFQDWELICCDDHSEDRTLNKLMEWQKKDSRIKVLSNQTNQKVAYTRNKCMQIAQGEYIAFIDDDDYCAPDRLEKQVAFLDQNPEYSFVGCNGFLFDEKGVWGQMNCAEKPQKEDFLWGACFINASLMVRAKDIREVGYFRVSKETRRTEDYDLFMRLYANGFYGYNLQEPLVYIYRGEKSYRKCKYRYRIDEAKIRYQNFKQLGLLPGNFHYILKPLIVGLLPTSYLENRQKRKYKKGVIDAKN